MITEISLEGFKAFGAATTIPLTPLTILSGPNSCGKSSVIQSILLVKQTLESQNPTRALLMNSRYVHLGSFRTFTYGQQPDGSVRLSFTIRVPRSLTPARLKRLGTPRFFGPVARNLNFGQGRPGRSEPHQDLFLDVEYVLRARFVEKEDVVFVQRARYSGRSRVAQTSHAGFSLSFEAIDDHQYQLAWSNMLTERTRVLGMSDSGSTLCQAEFINLFPDFVSFDENSRQSDSGVLIGLADVKRLVRLAFDSISYIGPLREEPSRRYIYDDEILEIGLKGENAPYILAVEGSSPIPPYAFPEDTRWATITGSTLEQGLISWLDYMEISPSIIARLSQGLASVDLASPLNTNLRLSLADVGFGVSQVLPIITEGLRLAPGGTLILEQPEIHLHPRLQLRLADFMVSMALSGKNMLVETHSEHIINRLVRRIVEDEEHRLQSLVNMLFVQAEPLGSVIQVVSVDPQRGITNWPRGFFDQTADEQESIMRASLAYRSPSEREPSR